MVRPRFNLGPTLKTLNLFILRFIKRSGSENLGLYKHHAKKTQIYDSYFLASLLTIFELVHFKYVSFSAETLSRINYLKLS